jgi:hypothetical protein
VELFLLVEAKEHDKAWLARHGESVRFSDADGIGYYTLPVFPLMPIVQDTKGLTYVTYCLLFSNHLKQEKDPPPFPPLFDTAGVYRIAICESRRVVSNRLALEVKPATQGKERILTPFDYFCILDDHISSDKDNPRPEVLSRLKRFADRPERTLLHRWAAARLGLEYYREAEMKREQARQEQRELPTSVWENAKQYLAIGLELPDDFPLREKILRELAEREGLDKNYSKAFSYLNELATKYPYGRWGKSAESGIEELQERQKRDSSPLRQLTLTLTTPVHDVLPLEPVPVVFTLANNTEAPVAISAAMVPVWDVLTIRVALKGRGSDVFRPSELSISGTNGKPFILKPGARQNARGYLYYNYFEGQMSNRVRYPLESPGVCQITGNLKDNETGARIDSNALIINARQPIGTDNDAYAFLRNLQLMPLPSTVASGLSTASTQPRDTDSQGAEDPYREFLLYTVSGPRTEGQQKILEKQEEFIAKFPESTYARYIYYSLGRSYMADKDKLQRGVGLLEKAAGYDDFSLAANALYVLVDYHMKQGNAEGAKKYLAILTTKFPDSEFVKEAISLVEKGSHPNPR